MKKNALVILLISSAFNSAAEESTFKAAWTDSNGNNVVNLNVKNGPKGEDVGSVYLSGEGIINDVQSWKVRDAVEACPVDYDITIYPETFEFIDLQDHGGNYLLFAYRLLCVGGVDPGEIKYLAYQDGKKYALRGEEKIITPDENTYGGEDPPKPDYNLRNNKPLLNYMLNKWPSFSIRRY